MIRSALGKVAWVGRTASMVFGLALVLALVLVLAGGAALGQTAPQGAPDATCQASGSTVIGYIVGSRKLAQTFTAVNSGKLTSAQLPQVYRDTNDPGWNATGFTLEIRAVDSSGVPTSNVLASTTIPESEIPNGWSSITGNFPIGSAAQVVAGRQYALVLRISSGTGMWLGAPNNSCPDGSLYKEWTGS